MNPTNPFVGVRAALFDLDGTLVETHIDFPLMKREVLALADRYGVERDSLESLDILTVVETARERLIATGRASEGDRLRVEAFRRLEEIEVAHCGEPNEIPGASELLARLADRGIRVAIVTRNCRTVSLDLLWRASLACDALLTRDDVPRTKPDPAHLLAALALLGARGRRPETRDGRPDTGERSAQLAGLGTQDSGLCTSPFPVVMVGDHWMDIKAGHGARMRTIGVLHGRDVATFDPAPPDLLVESVADLIPLLDRA